MSSFLSRIFGGTPKKQPPKTALERPTFQKWSLDAPLCNFTVLDKNQNAAQYPLTLGASFQGFAVFGRTGSGKTTGTAEHLADAFLRKGYGGLVLCAKATEAEDWKRRAEKAGRGEDLIIFSPMNHWRFNFLEHELNSNNQSTEGVLSLLFSMSEVLQSDDGRQDIWERAAKELLRNSIDLLKIAGQTINPENLLAACADNEKIRKFFEGIESLPNNAFTESEEADFQSIKQYYEKEIFPMSEKTRTSLMMTISATLGNFKRSTMRDLFCTETNCSPAMCREGAIIVIDLAVKTNQDLGLLAAAVWKTSFQRTIEKYKTNDETRPVFLFADEAQFFVAAKTDGDFQTTARSSKCSTVYLTQNFPTLKSKFGGDQKAENKARGLLGNLVTKIFHANDDNETNVFAADVIGKTLITRDSQSASYGGQGVTGGTSKNQVIDYQIQPIAFQGLATGGSQNNHLVTAIIFAGGNEFPNGKRHATCCYKAIYG
jgi:type IV secretory pathway TraG/TraD family ATPase VirD4